MNSYLLRKCVTLMLSLAVVIIIAFVLMKSAPETLFRVSKPFQRRSSGSWRAAWTARPFLCPVGRYISQLAHLSLGKSLIYPDRNVVDMIATSFPTSALLGMETLLVCVPLGLLLGMSAALCAEWLD